MIQAAKHTLGVALLLTAFCCACGITAAEASIQDIIPVAWISHNGVPPSAITPSAAWYDAFLFPSPPREPTSAVTYEAPEFLAKRNAIPAHRAYCLRRRRTCDVSESAHSESAHIEVRRRGDQGPDLSFQVSPAGVAEIRTWTWERFRYEQGRFERWPWNESSPSILANLFRRPRSRFNQAVHQGTDLTEYEYHLQEFWRRSLASAEVAAQLSPVTRWSPNPKRYSPTEPHCRENQQDYGPHMGAIPLEPGMRLVVRWGATAVYSLGATYRTQFVRQTTGGTSHIDVTYREDRVTLGLPRFLTPSPASSEAARSGAWTIASKAAAHGSLDAELFLPFGTKDAVGGHLVPVFNELDFSHVDALRKKVPQDEGPASVAPHLTLLIPVAYTKPDLAREEGGLPKKPTPGTHDAFEPSQPDHRLLQSFARRYILWGSSTRFADPCVSAPVLNEKDADQIVSEWEYVPLIFGDQTSLSIELPVSLNGRPAVYVPLGFTWGDVLVAHARWLLTPSPLRSGGPAITIRRSTIRLGSGAPEVVGRVLRVHGAPSRALHRIEVNAGDALFYEGADP